ncbi:MAG TPA: hypothetical protein VG273_15310 [Bryobacteraceae bacterium]|nr:hypothetical protein [Bryobacteraceae bacterium]
MGRSVGVLAYVVLLCGVFGGTARAEGHQSLLLSPGVTAESRPFPNAAPYKAIKDVRVEFRLHGFQQPSDWNAWIMVIPEFEIRFTPSQFLLHVIAALAEPENQVAAIPLERRKDVLVRLQRNLAARTVTLETWDVDGSNYAVSIAHLKRMDTDNWAGKTITLGGASTLTRIAYLRLYSTLAPLKASPPAHADGDLADWEFDGSLTEKSNRKIDLRVSSGRPLFDFSPSYAPKARFGEFGAQRTFRAGKGTLLLDGSDSFSGNDDAPLKFAWQQVAGPSPGHFENPAAAKTSFTAAAPGTYKIRLTITDSAEGTAFTEVKMGAVPTDDDGVVLMGPEALTAFGPLTMSGTSPWPWYDFAEMANADVLRPLQTTPPHSGLQTLSGTVSPTAQDSLAITGTGTHFLTELTACSSQGGSGSAYTCKIQNLTSYAGMADNDWLPDVACSAGASLNINGLGALPLYWGGSPVVPANCPAHAFRRLYYNAAARRIDLDGEGPLIWFWWNAPDGAGSGRMLDEITSVQDDTHLTLSAYYLAPLAKSQNIKYSMPGRSELGTYWNYVAQPSNSLDYYDNVLALYRVYYRTGIDTYLDQARKFADNWWKYAADYGYAISAPRVIGLLGLIARAVDGRPDMWPGIDFNLNYPWGPVQMLDVKTPQPMGASMDGREAGYMTRFAARAAALMPGADKKTFYCGRLHNIVANWWVSTQDDLGQWEEDLYSGNVTYPAARLNGRFGSSPYRAAMGALALEESYDVLRDACKDPATAEAAFKAARRFADFAHDYSEGKGYGQIPNVQFGSRMSGGTHAYNKAPGTELPNTRGTLSVTRGSNVVNGAGSNFTSLFPVPAQYIGIPAIWANGRSCNRVLKVASVQSDTSLTLEEPWPCESAAGIDGHGYGWSATPAASTDCARLGSLKAQTCEGDPDPSLSHEIHAMWAWLYWKTGDEKYKTWAQQTMGTDYGGPKGGPGIPGEPAGPFATGTVGNFAAALPACGAPDNAPPPCGGYGPASGSGKSFGFSSGAGNAPNALAYLVLGDRQQKSK